MHIQRIQVPDFRALKNVDITFEKEFTPRIFPLGSLNGGGKSTLLQLIFVLLHCSGNPDRVEFIQNLLHDFHVNDESGKRTLAIIDIWDGSKTISLDFFVCNESYIVDVLKEHNQQQYQDDEITEIVRFYFSEGEFSNKKIDILEKEKSRLEEYLQEIDETYDKNDKEHLHYLLNRITREMGLKYKMNISSSRVIPNSQISKFIEILKIEINKIDLNITREGEKKDLFDSYFTILDHSLKDNHSAYICDFVTTKSNKQPLLVKMNGIDTEEDNLLKTISDKIFLTAHISQIFLFLQPDNRKSLFKKQENNQTNYYQQIKTANSKLPGFFTYDFLAIDILIEAFKKARDEDFKQAVEQGGSYGNNYVKLLAELNNLLSNKKTNVQPDLSGINFRIHGDETELYPEDLSHGELKRLCIYMWLKYNNIKDAIVLMDELEISFHPDWQYQIVRDLEEWGATNQYILATHSYEICQAVTPAHVKELEPKLPSKTI